MKTIRRDRLMALAQAGKLEMIGSYHYDEMTGQSGGSNPGMPVRLSSGYGDFVEGKCNLHAHDFTSSCGHARQNDNGTIDLYVHSNCHYTFRVVNGGQINPARSGPAKGKRPENVRMQNFLAGHGIIAAVKYIADGSMRGTWRMYNSDLFWTPELAEKLTALGFTDFDGEPLGKFAGNGGSFSVFVRGHNELLKDSTKTEQINAITGDSVEKAYAMGLNNRTESELSDILDGMQKELHDAVARIVDTTPPRN